MCEHVPVVIEKEKERKKLKSRLLSYSYLKSHCLNFSSIYESEGDSRSITAALFVFERKEKQCGDLRDADEAYVIDGTWVHLEHRPPSELADY